MPSSLLEDILSEEHNQLLEKGNLNRPRRSSEWTGENNFLFSGYEARVHSYVCLCCGKKASHLEGIYLLETSPKAVKKTRLNLRFPGLIPNSPRTLHRTETSVEYCPECISALGFPQP